MAFLPEIDDDVPLPVRASDVMPNLSPTEELEMRVNTMKMLADLSGKPIQPTPEHQAEAYDLAKQMMTNPKMRPEFARYPNEVMAYLAGMVSQSNCMLVDELADLKLYVVNKLIYEVEHAKDSKSRIAALGKLGEVDGVDAFKKRSEMTIQVKPIEEVEKELLSVLDNIEYAVLPSEKSAASEENIGESAQNDQSVEDCSDDAYADQ
jgi:hypothetical protein